MQLLPTKLLPPQTQDQWIMYVTNKVDAETATLHLQWVGKETGDLRENWNSLFLWIYGVTEDDFYCDKDSSI